MIGTSRKLIGTFKLRDEKKPIGKSWKMFPSNQAIDIVIKLSLPRIPRIPRSRVFEEYQTYRDADTGEREMDWGFPGPVGPPGPGAKVTLGAKKHGVTLW